MGDIILVTGGARSGKSSFAEELAGSLGNDVLYIATSIPFDDEMKERIKKHRQQRPSGWTTIEAYKDLICYQYQMEKMAVVLLDCITVMVTNILFEYLGNFEDPDSEGVDEAEKVIHEEVTSLIRLAQNIKAPIIIVTNEVGMGIVPGNVISRVFRDIAGRVNQTLAKAAKEVFLCVSGIPIRIKG